MPPSVALKFLTPEVYDAAYREDDWTTMERAADRYRQHLQTIVHRLPRDVRAVSDAYHVDDALISRLLWKSLADPLTLILRCGDLQIGYFDLSFEYGDPEIETAHLAVLAHVVRHHRGSRRFWGMDLFCQEFDVLPDGKFEHRLLFHPGIWCAVRCSDVRVVRTDKPNRQLIPFIHRIRLPDRADDLE